MIEMNVDSIVDMLEYENEDYLEDIDDLESFDEWISKWDEYDEDLL